MAKPARSTKVVSPPELGRSEGGRRASSMHGESWLLRVLLAAAVGTALVSGRPTAAFAAAVAFVVSLVPTLLRHASRRPVQRGLEFLFVLGVTLVGVSDGFNLYDRIVNWGKLVHGGEGLLVTTIVSLLLLGYRDRVGIGLPSKLTALVAVFAGVTFGAFWEFVEFALDWIRYSDLQKSNADVMTDMLWNDLAAVAAMLLAFHAYAHWATRPQREHMVATAAWMFAPLSRLLERHGRVVLVLALLALAAYVGALWYNERTLPFVAPR